MAIDTNASAIILHGATRSAGDFVVDSTDRAEAVAVAGDSLQRLVDGLRRQPAKGHR